MGRFRRQDDIARTPARADRDEHVAWASQCLDLSREDAVEPDIVREGRQKRRVGSEGDGRERWAIDTLIQAANELGRHVLAVGRATAVATKEHLAPNPKRLCDDFGGLADRVYARLGGTASDLGAVKQMLTRHPCPTIGVERHQFAHTFAKGPGGSIRKHFSNCWMPSSRECWASNPFFLIFSFDTT